MRLLSINMNDFGGSQEHLMEHKKYNAKSDFDIKKVQKSTLM